MCIEVCSVSMYTLCTYCFLFFLLNQKGTIIERLTEETLRDWSHLKQLLSVCEGAVHIWTIAKKQIRSIKKENNALYGYCCFCLQLKEKWERSTNLNETSSRSQSDS